MSQAFVLRWADLQRLRPQDRRWQNVTESYRVALPDGRTLIVNFEADSTNGYTADVKYEGEAQYPESKSSFSARY